MNITQWGPTSNGIRLNGNTVTITDTLNVTSTLNVAGYMSASQGYATSRGYITATPGVDVNMNTNNLNLTSGKITMNGGIIY